MPGVFIASDVFVDAAEAQAKALGVPAARFFVAHPIQDRTDEEALVVARGDLVFALLNLYPYNSGHLMLVPFRHVASYDELTPAEAAEIAGLTQHALRALRHVSGAQGFNVGMNLGVVGGAGIAAHLHQHVVPRWGGDTNFMPVVGHTRVLPQLLPDTRALLAQAWSEV